MKQKNKNRFLFLPAALLVFTSASINCNNSNQQIIKKEIAAYDKDVMNSVLLSTDSLRTASFLEVRVNEIKLALQQPRPVLLCKDSLSSNQSLAQLIALNDSGYTQFLIDPFTKRPLRNEVFGVYPVRQSDMESVKLPYTLSSTYRVEMYNYALNNSSVALVDIQQQKVLYRYFASNAQPDIPENLKRLAIKIAIESPEVQNALGIKPAEADALMASTKTSLNRSRCERSRHLCVAPTFVKGDKALWAIVDLTDYRLVGIRWTNVGTTGPAAPMLTERKLQDDKITACFCEVEQSVQRNGWDMKYILTSSDGLRISDVRFKGKAVLRNAKLVDWHVSYSGTDGFGYSDAIGCPYFSQAAVVAWEIPKIAALTNDQNNTIGFVLEQTFRSEGWPTPCNYNYLQRYEFYNDGRFRISCASLGRGCGKDGTYRPVFRIAFAGEQNNFYQWQNSDWVKWTAERWNEQTAQTNFSQGKYLYKISDNTEGYYIEPGNSQFKDGGKGDYSFVYVTKQNKSRDEGETDLVTIGPCCNTDYHQGPEKFIEPQPEDIQQSSLVVWYVAQLKNNDQKGNEYCWAESILENGLYVTKTYPCFCGPMFIPLKN